MIKDKITHEIRDRFKDAISRTMKTGREHGFILCRDDKEDLFSMDICEGRECRIILEMQEEY
jgi:hypothetical protein